MSLKHSNSSTNGECIPFLLGPSALPGAWLVERVQRCWQWREDVSKTGAGLAPRWLFHSLHLQSKAALLWVFVKALTNLKDTVSPPSVCSLCYSLSWKFSWRTYGMIWERGNDPSLLLRKQMHSLHIHCKYLTTTLHIYCSCSLCNVYCSIWLILCAMCVFTALLLWHRRCFKASNVNRIPFLWKSPYEATWPNLWITWNFGERVGLILSPV